MHGMPHRVAAERPAAVSSKPGETGNGGEEKVFAVTGQRMLQPIYC
jgi:hypothetical protein